MHWALVAIKMTTVSLFLLLQSAVFAVAETVPSALVCQQVFEQYGVYVEGCSREDSVVQDGLQGSVSIGSANATADANTVVVSSALIAPLDRATKADRLAESLISFAAGGSVLSSQAIGRIDRMLRVLETRPMQNACVQLIGHSDSSGGAQANYQLALKRAQAVADRMRAGLSNQERVVSVISQGEESPMEGVLPTDPKNRRVEVWARSCVPVS